MLFGRAASLPDEVTQSLENHYDNVSRRHVEFRYENGELWVLDLGSNNGTFVNGVRLAAHVPVQLFSGAQIRCAADLSMTVHLGDEMAT